MTPKQCEHCGEPVNVSDHGGPVATRIRATVKRYCAETCRKRAERARARLRTKDSNHAA
jgi:antitoxin (DNA-binding transcriptional repressor) of toxin-antitoxin stability system